MKYCKTCLQPDTRPNTVFTKDQICPACRYFEELKTADWRDRFHTIEEIVSSFKKQTTSKFDCLIGVSGGKDSTRQALWARDKLGLNPLLVCLSYPPQQITNRGAENISNLIELGFDTVIVNPQPQTWKKVVKEGFLKFSNWSKGTELALISSAPQIAIKYKIPLILWGENPGLQLGDMKTLGRTGYDGNRLRFLNTIAGGNMDWLIDSGFKTEDLICFKYPELSEFEKLNIQIIYLGWFWNDWSLIQNGLYATSYGLKPRIDGAINTGDITKVSALDEDWVTLNQMIKFYKFGFGRVTDYVNEQIRYGIMKRDEGIKLVEKYDGSCSSEYIKSFCSYIDISENFFWEHIHAAVNKNLFKILPNKKIVRRFKVGVDM